MKIDASLLMLGAAGAAAFYFMNQNKRYRLISMEDGGEYMGTETAPTPAHAVLYWARRNNKERPAGLIAAQILLDRGEVKAEPV